ncbi:MAG: hypothetical protein KGS73_03900 [Chloroflexi bacterium]|nr:hypothetical protein [Chloroflexota bacterium]
MGQKRYLWVGALLGVGVALLLAYLLGPAPGTQYDANYRSRLDHALDEGRRAAAEQEERLRRRLNDLRRPG